MSADIGRPVLESGDVAALDYEVEFRDDWRSRLSEHVAEAIGVLSRVEGVRGLILAGSNGRGDPWPLSDVDLLMIVDDTWPSELQDELESLILETERRWKSHGFATGLDAGKLTFTRYEVLLAADSSGPAARELLNDQRWYHSLDKGYLGKPAYDPNGLALALVDWFNRTRFDSLVIGFRLDTQRRQAINSLEQAYFAIGYGDLLNGTRALVAGAGAVGTWLIEGWRERQSFARSATRLERAAHQRGRRDQIERLWSLTDADDSAVLHRIRAAPDPIRRWHAQSYWARQAIGEPVTETQDARDVLGVARHYELRKLLAPPFPEWLSVIGDIRTLERRTEALSRLIDEVVVSPMP